MQNTLTIHEILWLCVFCEMLYAWIVLFWLSEPPYIWGTFGSVGSIISTFAVVSEGGGGERRVRAAELLPVQSLGPGMNGGGRIGDEGVTGLRHQFILGLTAAPELVQTDISLTRDRKSAAAAGRSREERAKCFSCFCMFRIFICIFCSELCISIHVIQKSLY